MLRAQSSLSYDTRNRPHARCYYFDENPCLQLTQQAKTCTYFTVDNILFIYQMQKVVTDIENKKKNNRNSDEYDDNYNGTRETEKKTEHFLYTLLYLNHLHLHSLFVVSRISLLQKLTLSFWRVWQ